MIPKEYSYDEWKNLLTNNSPFDEPRISQSLKQGIPEDLRSDIWLYLSKSNELISSHLYPRLLETSDSEVTDQISKDLSRTFPQLSNSDQVNLLEILSAYSQLDIQVGYCQGMSFVTGTLLLVIKEKELSFWALVHLMYDRDWRSVYLPGTPKLNTLQLSLSRKIEINLPEVMNHLNNNEFETIMLSQHFLTILAYKVRPRFSVRVMDLVLFHGGEVIVKVLFNMIKMKKIKILSLNQEYLFRYLMDKMVDECYEEFHISTLVADLIREV